MKRFALATLLVTVVAATVFAILNRPGAEAAFRVFITVNSNGDTVTKDDDVLTLREAMMLATGERELSDLSEAECDLVSDTSWHLGECTHDNPPGESSIDGIDFDTGVFPPGSPQTITLGSSLPMLSTGRDTVNGSGAGVIVDGADEEDLKCFRITSDNNAVRGLEIYNCDDGVWISGRNNTIGGSSPGHGNVISGGDDAVTITGPGASENVVKGNYIGTNAAGDAAVANHIDILIDQGAQNNTIGGTAAGERNVISGSVAGVVIAAPGTNGNVVKGNYIGTDASGTAPVPNDFGVSIEGYPQNNTVGGSSPGEGNVISGNSLAGVAIGYKANGNVVKGNYIGTAPTGDTAVANRFGVQICCGAQNNTIGGTTAAADNLIAFNSEDGVQVDGTAWDGMVANGNTIRGNSIHSNGGKGIELRDNGNAELEPPTVDSVGSVFGTACANCTVDIYSDQEDEGKVYEGSTTADVDGNWSFSGTPEGPNITATATDSDGNTSEFSEPLEPPWPAPSLSPTPSASPSPTPSPAPGATRTLQWSPGWHNATWSGASTPEEAFACAAGNYAAAYRLVTGGWERYFPDRPDLSNMTDLGQYDTFLILVTADVTCEMPVADPPGSERTLDWDVGWQNDGWTGADGTAPQDAFACAEGSYAAAYRLVSGGWERYFPGRPDISNMGPLYKYDAFLILVTAPVSCSMAIAP